MVIFDKTKEVGKPITGINGTMHGDVIVFQEEMGVIIEYFYRMMVGSGELNKDIFFNIIDEAIKRAEFLGIEKTNLKVTSKI